MHSQTIVFSNPKAINTWISIVKDKTIFLIHLTKQRIDKSVAELAYTWKITFYTIYIWSKLLFMYI